MDERRRYFRIEDTIGIHYERLNREEVVLRQAAIARGDYAINNELQEAERQLQLLIDKLRVQNPELSQAISLLNTKFNLLKNDSTEASGRPQTARASISACGLSISLDDELRAGEQVYLDLTLLPTDLHIQTIADVVESKKEQSESTGSDQWLVSMDFSDLDIDMEELLVQHIVKRQGRILAEKRRE